ncbi:Acyl-CoA synthetase (AMP-forming)/AMP-acid ligase II [Sphingopyxis sp. YR583]|uniref:acyl-CoA synthetase n=1 Tax=Sphingopyxis sp. YR583 TaxID=1881047 RepID=UPI0008A7E3D5|nr:long-chain fatty acid--CoA ligase [Sphingopyxis sp. YR583]SEH13880.1 Acyl-CoA synthetase (AMP-forming)/AMP-acid ligase II [Sphingopyxis sp. YR583]
MGHELSIHQALRRAVLLRGEGVAIIDGAKNFSWCTFAERCARLAGALHSMGVCPGARVALLALNSHRSLEAFFGVIHAGAAIVPLNHRLSKPELEAQLADSRPDAIILGDDYLSYADSFAEICGRSRLIHAGDGSAPIGLRSFDTLVAEFDPVAAAEEGGDTLACLLYTSGTTSAAKGVMLSHANLIANSLNTIPELGLGRDTVHLHHGPLFHVASAARLFSVTQAAGTHVVLPRFVAADVIAEIERARVTHATFVPTMFRAMLDEPSLATSDLGSLRMISYGSAPMPEPLLDEMMAALPQLRFLQSYGMTELSPVATILGWRDHLAEARGSGRLRSAGRPVLSCEVIAADPEGRPLPPGETGEILVRGPNVMLGYWDRPEATAEALRDGWMHSGDAGYLDDEGYLFIVDRLKDMIISGGENIYSQEVENILAAHPAVAECAVFGRPHPHWGEAVHAVVRLRQDAAVTEAELIAFCRERIAHYKCPRSIETRAAPMPLSGANKILKSRLREQLLTRDAAAPA